MKRLAHKLRTGSAAPRSGPAVRVGVTACAAAASALCTALPVQAQDDDLRVVDEPLTLTTHFHFRDKYVYDESWPVEKRAAELTGVSLENTASLATPLSMDAFNLMMASGNLPDVVGGNLIMESFNQYGPEGAFLPLDDLIEEHAPNIEAFFDDHPELRDAISAADGHVYFIPYLPDGEFGRAYFIRTDWLDKLGLEPPENVEQMHDVLVAFRDKDPNGNGKKDEVPFFGRDWEEMIRLVTLWGARTTGSDTYHDFYVADDELRHGYAEDAYRDGIAALSQWYAEGLIDREVFTRGNSARDYLLANDLGGMTHDWFASTAGYNDELADRIPGFRFEAFVPPEGTTGKRIEEHRRIPVKPDGWAMSYTNEHPEETMKYFDFWFTEPGRRLANFGIEGEEYDLVDGKPIFKQAILEGDGSVVSQLYTIGAQIPRGFWQDYTYEEQWTNQVALDGIALYEKGDYLVPNFLGVALNEDEKKVYDKYWPSVRTYMLEKQQGWILGSADVVEDWDNYLEQLDRLGFYKVLDAMRSAYERQYES